MGKVWMWMMAERRKREETGNGFTRGRIYRETFESGRLEQCFAPASEFMNHST
jgi:hypothetical protein